MILIAPPECAKTSILRGITCCGAKETMDLSQTVITKTLLPQIDREMLHHLVIPDLVKVLSHKTVTIDSTIAFLNAISEEGVKDSMFFGQEFHYDRLLNIGVLTSVTPEFFVKYFKKWNDIGFITRFLPISYKYSAELIANIHKLIEEDKLLSVMTKTEATSSINGHIDSKSKFKIGIESNASAFISLKSQEIAKKLSEYKVRIFVQGGHVQEVRPNIMGFRLQRQFRMLIKAIALSKNKTEADMTDVEELSGLLEYIGYPNAPKVL
jgi:hypothetical protein